MRNCGLGTLTISIIMATMLLASGFAFAAESTPMTPEYAAKQENVRKQREQRVTDDHRKAAAERLKAERIKVHKAKEAAKLSSPNSKD